MKLSIYIARLGKTSNALARQDNSRQTDEYLDPVETCPAQQLNFANCPWESPGLLDARNEGTSTKDAVRTCGTVSWRRLADRRSGARRLQIQEHSNQWGTPELGSRDNGERSQWAKHDAPAVQQAFRRFVKSDVQ